MKPIAQHEAHFFSICRRWARRQLWRWSIRKFMQRAQFAIGERDLFEVNVEAL